MPKRQKHYQDGLTGYHTQLKQVQNKISFLDLPPELRNAIYADAAQDTSVRLSRKSTHRTLTTGSALARVNKQVRDEFLSVAMVTASIETTARDFDFRHIVTFLNRLDDAELKTLSSITIPSERRVIIGLVLTEADTILYLGRWLNRAAHPTKKGTNLNYEYKIVSGRVVDPVPPLVSGRDGNLTHRQATQWREVSRYTHLRNQLKHMRLGRSKQELQKIVKALGM